MKKNLLSALMIAFCSIFTTSIYSQDTVSELMSDKTFSGLKMRSIGPAFTSGRISDIVIHPENNNLWYVAAASGGVWKTENSGVTWKPIFDKQSVYSIGCITIDPNNPHTVWVGSGENVGGRHVGYGDGIYRSDDDGENWTNMGLKESEHISKIIVHPKNAEIIWVASQGPLWSKGGERGVFKSDDGGKTWKKTLGDEDWTGATDIVIDPRNPDRLYAATWQRARTVAAYMGGGSGTAIYQSEDGGETWNKLSQGLPKTDMGKIGLAISPQQPDVIYAAIELERRTGAVYRSDNRGASWQKMSNAVSGATGPHYYQELYASPHQFDRIYLMDTDIQVSEDGGKTFTKLKSIKKHVDNHAIAFRDDEKDYLLVGTDGGVYESYDLAENWRFITNLPVTQFYKVAVNDATPFYFVFGGTQDNGTQGGPTQTSNMQGITNEDWTTVLGADGHQPATEPGNPNIMYGEFQEGFLWRIDLKTGEKVFIQPQPEEGEDYERYNWDSPILVSPHSPTRLYFGSQRLWRSENRGDSWKAISGDLTQNQERLELPIMEQTWSWDSPWDVLAMSNYNTITSIAESPVQEDLLYVGTDDGSIQVTEDGGANWKRIKVSQLPGVPETAFVNDIKADLFDAGTVYVALDNHKYGDFKPYLYKSTNNGKSWKSISTNLPDKTLVWRMVQDYVNKDLLFAATEFGIYFTLNGGQKWIKITGGVPTISFRDLAIQRTENDLVGASFGRSFYVFDDYSVLRNITEEQLTQEATLYPVPDAKWYFLQNGKYGQGASFFTAPNPPFGAVFTYYLKETYKTKKELRQENEKKLKKENKDIPFPGWEALDEEKNQPKPKIWLTVKDTDGNVVRRLPGETSKGFHRVAWDLEYANSNAISIDSKEINFGQGSNVKVGPGTYTVSLSKEIDGEITELSSPLSFNVVPLQKGTLDGAEPAEVVAFWKQLQNLWAKVSAANIDLSNSMKTVKAMELALSRTTFSNDSLASQLNQIRQELLAIEAQFSGNQSKEEIGEKNNPTIYSRLQFAQMAVSNSTYGPTETARQDLEIANKQFVRAQGELNSITEQKIPELEKKLTEAGAPVVK